MIRFAAACEVWLHSHASVRAGWEAFSHWYYSGAAGPNFEADYRRARDAGQATDRLAFLTGWAGCARRRPSLNQLRKTMDYARSEVIDQLSAEIRRARDAESWGGGHRSGYWRELVTLRDAVRGGDDAEIVNARAAALERAAELALDVAREEYATIPARLAEALREINCDATADLVETQTPESAAETAREFGVVIDDQEGSRGISTLSGAVGWALPRHWDPYTPQDPVEFDGDEYVVTVIVRSRGRTSEFDGAES